MLFATCPECGRCNNPTEGDGTLEWHIDWFEDREIVVVESAEATTSVTYEAEE